MTKLPLRPGLLALILASLSLAGCGGGGGGSSTPASYTVGGTVAGLNGSLVLQNSGADNLTLSADGSFTFATPIANGSAYAVTVLTQPTGQTCVIAAGSGTISANVTNVAVTCTTNSYTVGGAVSGLSGTVVLQNNGGDDLTVSADGSFTFATALLHNSSYAVTVLSQPVGQTCSVSAGSGMVSGNNVGNVALTCAVSTYSVGGTLSGLTGSVVLQNNGGDNLTIAANGAFTFATPVAYGSNYTVTVLTQPAGQSCSVGNGTGTVTGAVGNVTITCANLYTIGGTVSGLNGSMVLQNNGADDLTVSTNGTFSFATALPVGNAYSVTLLSLQFPGQACTITGGTGSVTGTVTNVAVSCARRTTPRFALVVNYSDNTVSSYIVDNTSGRLNYISKAATGYFGPQSVAVDPTGTYAYVVSYSVGMGNVLSQYTIGADGSLTPMTPFTVTTGAGPYSVAVHPTGKYAYVAIPAGTVWQYTIGGNGALTPMAIASVAAAAGSLSVTIDPTGKYAYVANYFSNNISQYTIGADGALTAMATATVAAGIWPYSVTVDPSGKYAYVANQSSGTVSQYTMDATGALTPMTPATAAAGINPRSVTVDPSGKYVYVANQGSGTVSQYTIGATGTLTPMATATVAAGTAPYSVTVDPSGKYTYVANDNSNTVSQYMIGANGALTPLAPVDVSAMSGPVSITIVPGAAPVQAVPKYAYVANQGGNSVSQFAIGATGALTAMATATVGAGTNPISVIVDPTGKYAYAANYNAGAAGSVSQYSIGASGALTAMATPAVAAANGPAAITIDPAGRYAYVTNWGSNSVSQYAIGTTGALTAMATPTVAAGTTPGSVTVDPSGKYAYVTNWGSTSVSQYAIGTTGALTAMATPTVTTGTNPNSITIDPSGKYAYVANYAGGAVGSVSQYTIGATGALTAMASATVAAGSGPVSVIVHPSGMYAYVLNTASNNVSQYSIGATGALTPMATATVATGTAPAIITIDASGQYAYVTNYGVGAGTTVSQYTIGATGALTPMQTATVAAGAGPRSIATTGTWQ